MNFIVDPENKYKSGIYFITNNIDNMFYIGRTNNFYKRYSGHIKVCNNDNFRYWRNKYGDENFNFFIVEICELDKLKERERYYINKYKNSGLIFNIR